jgi:hypothetical protein
MKWCWMCKEKRPLDEFYPSARNRDGRGDVCIPHAAEKHRVYTELKRRALLDAMGGKCVRCGFDDWRALQVDHVNGGGLAENRGGKTGSKAYYAKVLANPDDYQLLCANCNWIKKHERQESRRRKELRDSAPVLVSA